MHGMAVANWYDALRPRGGEASERVAEGGKCGVARAGQMVGPLSTASRPIAVKLQAIGLFNSPHTLGTTLWQWPTSTARRLHCTCVDAMAPNNVPPRGASRCCGQLNTRDACHAVIYLSLHLSITSLSCPQRKNVSPNRLYSAAWRPLDVRLI
jgi:hypothetical protein